MSPSLSDLQPLIHAEGPFLTLLLPAPSHHADAADRFAIQCKNALRKVSDGWPSDDRQALERQLADLPHDAGAAVIVIRSSSGVSHVEFIDDPVDPTVFEGSHPRLAQLIESRQRTIAHVMVDADKAGASLSAFDGGQVLESETVEGETEHIHRGHPGGWSQRRFQQRAENTWDENADDIAAAAHELADRVNARLVAVAGPPRARSMVVESLGRLVRNDAYSIESVEAGDIDGIADAVTRLTADIAASDAVAAIGRASRIDGHRRRLRRRRDDRLGRGSSRDTAGARRRVDRPRPSHRSVHRESVGDRRRHRSGAERRHHRRWRRRRAPLVMHQR